MNQHVIKVFCFQIIENRSFIFRALIAYINAGNVYTWQGVLLALGFVFVNFMSTICINYIFLLPGYMAGFRLRTIVTAAVYRKVGPIKLRPA